MSLEQCLEDLPDDDKQLTATRLVHLSNLGAEEMLGFVEAWAETGTERRRQAIAMLNELTEDNVDLDFNAVYRHTLGDSDDEVRAASISGLWECEERSLIDPIIRLMNDDPEEKVRAKAVQALGRFALLGETGKLLERDHGRIADALLAVIDNKGQALEVRRRAVEAVAPMSLPRVEGIIEQAYVDGDPKLKASAVYAMGLTCVPLWLPTLTSELDNEDPEMRYEAIGALAEIGEEDAVPNLLPLIQDSDPQVQAATIGALGAIGGAAAKEVLTRALDQEDSRIQDLAEAALQSMDFAEDPLGLNDLE